MIDVKRKLIGFYVRVVKVIGRIFRAVPYIVYFPAALAISKLPAVRERYGEVWVFGERPDEARDNAWHLYRFASARSEGARVAYVISKGAPDRRKFGDGDLLVQPNSFLHFLLFSLSSALISTHAHGAAPSRPFGAIALKILPRKCIVNLKHGITQTKRISRFKGPDITSCASPLEYECFAQADQRTKDSLLLLGHCRYDGLVDRSKIEGSVRRILVMPSFRIWLEDAARAGVGQTVFRRDLYFQAWQSLLLNRALYGLLEKHNAELAFYPHYRMQKFLSEFEIPGERVRLISKSDGDVQELLCSSSALVTDYSSVFFDFAYLNKPVVHYQFDRDRFYSEHYRDPVFIHSEDGFGPVCLEESDVVNSVEGIISSDWEVEQLYRDRVDAFFQYRDRSNCARTYDAISRIIVAQGIR